MSPCRNVNDHKPPFYSNEPIRYRTETKTPKTVNVPRNEEQKCLHMTFSYLLYKQMSINCKCFHSSLGQNTDSPMDVSVSVRYRTSSISKPHHLWSLLSLPHSAFCEPSTDYTFAIWFASPHFTDQEFFWTCRFSLTSLATVFCYRLLSLRICVWRWFKHLCCGSGSVLDPYSGA